MKYEKLIYLTLWKFQIYLTFKIPGNDGLTKQFYKTFWDELETPVMESINWAFYSKTLSISQKQAIIKVIEKKDRDRRYIKNWRPISLLNVDTKILSKDILKNWKLLYQR